MNIKTIAKIIGRVVTHHESLTACFNDTPITPEQKAVCYGVIRWYLQLEQVANTLLHKPLKTKNQPVLHYICIGLFQVRYGNTPNHAAVKEVVDAVKKSKFRWAEGLINKLLRNFIDKQESIFENLEKNVLARHAHPEWMNSRMNEETLIANNAPAPMTLRVNLEKTSRHDYKLRLQEKQIEARALTSSSSALQLSKPTAIDSLPGFYKGLCSVQDEAGQLVVQQLDLQPGQRVLDACCAPGSKTGHILETEPNLEKLIAIDIDSERLKKVNDTIKRIGFDKGTIDLVTADAVNTKAWWDEKKFDRILIDAPCSGSGVIRRHPDIKLLRRESDLETLQQKQLDLLNTLWPLLKKGGRLIYSTCSIFKEENDTVIEQFLASHNAILQEKIQLLPAQNGQDGFFIATILSQ